MKCTLILLTVHLIGASLKAQHEPPKAGPPAKIEKGQYYMLRKDVHDKLERQISTLDSLQATLDSLNQVNRKIYTDMLSLESELEQKMNEAYYLRQSLVDNQIYYEATQDQFYDLRKKYFQLKYHKPEKVIITRKKILMPSDERKTLIVLGFVSVSFALTSILVTSILK